jgi:glycosyltransferase involved in cell wall biosynthesis
MSKKIAFLLTRFQDKALFGGGELISFNLIKKLCKRGYIIDVYCEETNVEKNYGVNKIIVGKNQESDKTIWELMQIGYYSHAVTENHSYPNDITLAHGHSMLYRQKIARNPLERLISKVFKGSRQDFIEYQQKNLNANNLIIVPSNICKHDYSKYLNIDENKIKVIYPAVNIPYKPEQKKKNEVFTFGLSAPGFSNKGGYLFLKALFLLKLTGHKFRAKIIYQGYSKNILVKFLVKVFGLKNTVDFMEFQSDMQHFYDSVDCMVVASSLETFGMVILESMANKVPVIASSRCGGAEIVEDGKNGFIFDYEKHKTLSLFKKMSFMLKNSNTLTYITENSYNIVKSYNWDKYCDDFIKCI